MDKGAFLKHFSPDRNPIDSSLNHPQNQRRPLSTDRECVLSSDTAVPRAAGKQSQKKDNTNNQKKTKILNKKLVEQLMRENFKQLRAKEEAEEMSRRKIQNEALIQKELLKKP